MKTQRIVLALVALTTASAAVFAPPGRADIDASGAWFMTGSPLSESCHLGFTQSGTSRCSSSS